MQSQKFIDKFLLLLFVSFAWRGACSRPQNEEASLGIAEFHASEQAATDAEEKRALENKVAALQAEIAGLKSSEVALRAEIAELKASEKEKSQVRRQHAVSMFTDSLSSDKAMTVHEDMTHTQKARESFTTEATSKHAVGVEPTFLALVAAAEASCAGAGAITGIFKAITSCLKAGDSGGPDRCFDAIAGVSQCGAHAANIKNAFEALFTEGNGALAVAQEQKVKQIKFFEEKGLSPLQAEQASRLGTFTPF
eukprot:TRINITY_DN82311_c0_g1_i1.p1 TRINITY_DN82311_c0_g1~~TRINITY_DN82311_c0_g1_i1.p1  ORF type:complete len:252 (-),score=57.32 TRINITY_DN82311_c0_g1_i1:143-898(-)